MIEFRPISSYIVTIEGNHSMILYLYLYIVLEKKSTTTFYEIFFGRPLATNFYFLVAHIVAAALEADAGLEFSGDFAGLRPTTIDRTRAEISPDELTPKDALELIYRLKELLTQEA